MADRYGSQSKQGKPLTLVMAIYRLKAVWPRGRGAVSSLLRELLSQTYQSGTEFGPHDDAAIRAKDY